MQVDAILYIVFVATDVDCVLQGCGRTGESELESGSMEGGLTRSKHDEVLEGVEAGNPTESEVSEAVDGSHSSRLHRSGDDERGDECPPVRSLSDEVPSGMAGLSINDEKKEIPAELKEQSEAGAAVAEERKAAPSEEKDCLAVVEGQC